MPARRGPTRPQTEFDRADAAAKFVLSKTKLRPRIAIVLGSGLGAFADSLTRSSAVAFAEIPGFPTASAEGHAGALVVGMSGSVPLAALQGRLHFYEGHPMSDVIFPMRVFARMGIKAAILTNAAGGVNRGYKPGSLVVLRDHINLQGTNPLVGKNDKRFGPRFFDMSRAYWPKYRELALKEGERMGLSIYEGVYAAIPGPSYETPAEIRFMRTIGADLAGMSTVPEAIAAAHMGIKVLGISCVTNMAAGVTDEVLSHVEVLRTGAQVRDKFAALITAVIPAISKDVAGRA